MNTLEARLQAVARRMVSRPGVQGENGDSAQQRAQQGVLRGVLMTTPSGSSPTMQGIPMGMQGSQHHVKLENGMPTLQGAGSLMGGAGVALASPHQLGVGQMMAPLMSPAHAGMQQGMKQDPGAGLPMRPQSTGPLMPNPMAGPSGSALMGSSSQGGTPTVVSSEPIPCFPSPVVWIPREAQSAGDSPEHLGPPSFVQGGVNPVQLGGVSGVQGASGPS